MEEKKGIVLSGGYITFDRYLYGSTDIIYVENEYQPQINQYIKDNYDLLAAQCEAIGKRFVYLPKIAQTLASDGSWAYVDPTAFSRDVPLTDAELNKLLNPEITDYKAHKWERSPYIASPVSYASTKCCLIHFRSILEQNSSQTIIEHGVYEFYEIPDGRWDLLLNMILLIGEACADVTKRLAELRAQVSKDPFGPIPYIPYVPIVYSDINIESFDMGDDADGRFEIESQKLMDEIREKIKQLRKWGVDQLVLQSLVSPHIELSELVITSDYRFFLTQYNNTEICMSPLPKAVYLLFLRHPEGIRFKYLPDYEEELLSIYQAITHRTNDEKIRTSIHDVCDPTKNSINEKCARIREAFVNHFDENIVKQYIIDGDWGCPKYIALPRELVKYE
ncbi:MAG: hypothetical protein KBT06_01185 [Prevotellaceae bacterium]|nr:hypothetical protein [Candidatus Colivivens equi]